MLVIKSHVRYLAQKGAILCRKVCVWPLPLEGIPSEEARGAWNLPQDGGLIHVTFF